MASLTTPGTSKTSKLLAEPEKSRVLLMKTNFSFALRRQQHVHAYYAIRC